MSPFFFIKIRTWLLGKKCAYSSRFLNYVNSFMIQLNDQQKSKILPNKANVIHEVVTYIIK